MSGLSVLFVIFPTVFASLLFLAFGIGPFFYLFDPIQTANEERFQRLPTIMRLNRLVIIVVLFLPLFPAFWFLSIVLRLSFLSESYNHDLLLAFAIVFLTLSVLNLVERGARFRLFATLAALMGAVSIWLWFAITIPSLAEHGMYQAKGKTMVRGDDVCESNHLLWIGSESIAIRCLEPIGPVLILHRKSDLTLEPKLKVTFDGMRNLGVPIEPENRSLGVEN